MQTEFSSALAKHLMATYAPDASGNAWMLARLHKAVKDPNLVTLDPALNVKREDINITPADLAVFFYYAALGIDMAHEHTIMGVPLNLPKGSLRVYTDEVYRGWMKQNVAPYKLWTFRLYCDQQRKVPNKTLPKINPSFSRVVNDIVGGQIKRDLLRWDANYPERSLVAHESIVLAFLEEARHAHQQSLNYFLQDAHYAKMRRDVPVNPMVDPLVIIEYTESDPETDVRNLHHEIFTIGDGFSRISEPEQVYRHFGAVMPQPGGVG